MMLAMDNADGSPEAVARAFLAALDERRWHDAAALVDAETRERFRTFWIARLESEAGGIPDNVPTDTHFVSAAELLGLKDAASAARLASTELLARCAEAIHRGNFIHHPPGAPAPAGDGEIRIARTIVESTPLAPDRIRFGYRTEGWHGESRNEASTDVHSLELIRTSTGWAVRDADLSGLGSGHILPPPT